MYPYGNSGSSGNVAGIIIGVIIGVIVLFLICRELICWYYKINKLVGLMEEQNRLLSKIAWSNSSQATTSTQENNSNRNKPINESFDGNVSKPRTPSGDTWICKHCGTINSTAYDSCEGCGRA